MEAAEEEAAEEKGLALVQGHQSWGSLQARAQVQRKEADYAGHRYPQQLWNAAASDPKAKHQKLKVQRYKDPKLKIESKAPKLKIQS